MSEKEILFKDVTLVQFDPPIAEERRDVLVRGDRIVRADSAVEPRIIEGRERLLFPGMVNSHHHMYSGLSRGIMAPIGDTPDFVSVLKNLWWRLDRGIDREILKSSVKICCLDALKCGTTSIIDHHSSPSFISGSLTLIKEVMEEIGLRGALCYETSDRNGLEGAEEGAAENKEFALSLDKEKSEGQWEGLIEAFIGGHAPFTLSEETLELISRITADTGRGFHVHLGEDAYDGAWSHHLYGEGLARRLERHGLLNEKTLLAHGTHLSDGEMEIINKHGAFLLHNPTSNMNNHVGYTSRLWQAEKKALGTDGIGADMFGEMKTAYFKHKDDGGPLFPGDYLPLLTGGNRILDSVFGEAFPGKFGKIEPGCPADLVLADYDSPTPFAGENMGGHMVFGMGQGIVNTVMVGGQILVENHAFAGDLAGCESDICGEAREQARRLWKNMENLT